MNNKNAAFDVKNPALQQPQVRKGEFKEVARGILHKDRYSLKHRISVDTGGSIARALENAYKLGLAHGSQKEPAQEHIIDDPDGPLSWNAIPAKSRNILDRIFRFKWIVMYKKNADPYAKNPDKWVCYWDWGDKKPPSNQFELAQSFSVSTIAPLIRLGLMRENKSNDVHTLLPTKKGMQTWQDAMRQREGTDT